MKQYKITAADFVSPGESLVPDAVLSDEDKATLGLAPPMPAKWEGPKEGAPMRPKMSDFLAQQINARKAGEIKAIDVDMPEQKPNV